MAVLAGDAYKQLGQRRDRKRFPQVGCSVDIGGRSLNIYCSGEGSPAVILDTGGSAPGYENLILQRQIAQFARACWFDRAGLGWSDPSPIEQTSAAIAEDLHALLHVAGVAPPYVLVGASFSGFNVRVFSGKYPAEVAGVGWFLWIQRTKTNSGSSCAPTSRPSTGFRRRFEVSFAHQCHKPPEPGWCDSWCIDPGLAGTRLRDLQLIKQLQCMGLSSKPNRLWPRRAAMLSKRAQPKRTPRVILATVH